MTSQLAFEAIAEATPGAKWKRRWDLSWPAYEAWFLRNGGEAGPSRAECDAAVKRHMPELVGTHARLTELTGGGGRAARFLSGWCPPAYLSGCSIAAQTCGGKVSLVRNYDLSPDLNEGLLLRSEWRRPVMGMVEFLWGLSDGINDAGLSIALAYGGRKEVRRGFGITMIVRYLLETCESVAEALDRLKGIPSHMAYNLVLADATGQVASVELFPGGGFREMPAAVATNHQQGAPRTDRDRANRTVERRAYLETLLESDAPPNALSRAFLSEPLFQRDFAGGFGTLFTAEYTPARKGLTLLWQGQTWSQTLSDFEEGQRLIVYDSDVNAIYFADWSYWGARAPSSWQLAGQEIAQQWTSATTRCAAAGYGGGYFPYCV